MPTVDEIQRLKIRVERIKSELDSKKGVLSHLRLLSVGIENLKEKLTRLEKERIRLQETYNRLSSDLEDFCQENMGERSEEPGGANRGPGKGKGRG